MTRRIRGEAEDSRRFLLRSDAGDARRGGGFAEGFRLKSDAEDTRRGGGFAESFCFSTAYPPLPCVSSAKLFPPFYPRLNNRRVISVLQLMHFIRNILGAIG